MPKSSPIVYLLAILCTSIALPAQAGVQRAFVASYGLNSNTTFSCDVTHPCRQFIAAVTVVNPGGEVVAIDTAAYGTVTLTQSISLTAAPGSYAGITAFPGATGVTIATPGVNVVLRGLTINGQGGDYGIKMTTGTKLSIENCVISNFNDGVGGIRSGIFVDTAAAVNVVDTLVRDNSAGIELKGGALAIIANSKFLGNVDVGILSLSTAGMNSGADVSDTVVAGGGDGVVANSGTSGSSKISIIHSTISQNTGNGIATSGTAGTASITLGYSKVTGNAHGFIQGTGGTLNSQGNNMIINNGTNTGVLTPLTSM